MDSHGYFSLALNGSYAEAMIDKAKRIFVEVNDKQPRCLCGTQLHVSQVDAIVEYNHELPVLPPVKLDEISITIGNLIAQFCIARGAKNVLITDVSDLRLDKARECGIEHTLNITKKPLKAAAQELFGEEGYQVGFEVAGVEGSIRSLMETIEKGSDIVVVAVFAKDPALSMFHLGEHELRLIGSMMYRHEDYLTAIDYVSKGIVNLKPLISNRFAFEEYDNAYRFIDSHRETSMKVIIDLDQKPQEKK